jgi:hypothetical protein
MESLQRLYTITCMYDHSFEIIGRDFNIITSLKDKIRGTRRLDLEGDILLDIE